MNRRKQKATSTRRGLTKIKGKKKTGKSDKEMKRKIKKEDTAGEGRPEEKETTVESTLRVGLRCRMV